MKKLYSKIEEEQLLHIVVRGGEDSGKRVDVSPESEYLQLAQLRMHEGQTFRPHKHLTLLRQTDITQESWVVIRGRVKAMLYDLDDTILSEEILEAGDCSITFRGGHNYEALDDDTLVYEYKTGPYMGQARDKVFIDGED
jgi:hypothetical protein